MLRTNASRVTLANKLTRQRRSARRRNRRGAQSSLVQALQELQLRTVGANAPSGKNKTNAIRRNDRRGLSEKYTSAPLAMGQTLRNTGTNEDITVSGMDWIEADVINSGTPDGTLLVDLDMNPNSLPGTHLTQVARAFERYKFIQLDAEITSRAPTSAAGGYLAGFTPDVYQTLSSNTSMNKRYVRSLYGSISAPIWLSEKVTMSVGNEPFYYNSDRSAEGFKTTQSRLLVLLDGKISNISGSISLTICLRWKIKLMVPALDMTGSRSRTWDVGTTAKIQQLPDYNGVSYADGTSLVDWWAASIYDTPYLLDPPQAANVLADKKVMVFVPSRNPDKKTFRCYETITAAYDGIAAGDVKTDLVLKNNAQIPSTMRLVELARSK